MVFDVRLLLGAAEMPRNFAVAAQMLTRPQTTQLQRRHHVTMAVPHGLMRVLLPELRMLQIVMHVKIRPLLSTSQMRGGVVAA